MHLDLPQRGEDRAARLSVSPNEVAGNIVDETLAQQAA